MNAICLKDFGPLSEFLLKKKALYPNFDTKKVLNFRPFSLAFKSLKPFISLLQATLKAPKSKQNRKVHMNGITFPRMKNDSSNSAFLPTRSPTHCNRVGNYPFRGRYSQLDWLEHFFNFVLQYFQHFGGVKRKQ